MSNHLKVIHVEKLCPCFYRALWCPSLWKMDNGLLAAKLIVPCQVGVLAHVSMGLPSFGLHTVLQASSNLSLKSNAVTV